VEVLFSARLLQDQEEVFLYFVCQALGIELLVPNHDSFATDDFSMLSLCLITFNLSLSQIA